MQQPGAVPLALEDDEEMYLLLYDMVSGGSETTSTTTQWAIAELVRCPDALARLRDELDAFHARKDSGADVAKLPYLQVGARSAYAAVNGLSAGS